MSGGGSFPVPVCYLKVRKEEGMDYPTVDMIMEKVKDADNAIIERLQKTKTSSGRSFQEERKLLEAREHIQKALNCLLET